MGTVLPPGRLSIGMQLPIQSQSSIYREAWEPGSGAGAATMDEPLSFGTWLQRRRKAHGLTQAQLGQRIGCSASLIRKLEADERRPSAEVGARLAAELHVAAEERASFVPWARYAAAAEPRAWFNQHAPARTHNDLPRPPTALLGREQDVAAVRALLASTPGQLVTLVGPPGIGKTRLSLAVAAEARSSCPDGVYFVPLAAVRDPALILPAIARTLGVHQAGGHPLLVCLRQVLTDKQVVLVLDNLEQIVEAAPVVGALLAALPHLRVVVTSRVPLHVYGEQEYAVPPLAVPELRSDPSLEGLSRVGSVQLFVQRAQAAQFDFRLTPANAAPVAAICRRLDGLPLALELAAARIKVLPPEALLGQLAASLDVLTGGPTNVPPRHRTLRNAIGWSFDLLTPDEQTLLRRLAVFAGGWTLEAAEAIGATGGRHTVLDTLQALIDKSLVQRVAGVQGEPRFGMLELIREFALEQLLASGEEAALHARHVAYFVSVAESVEAQLAQGEEAPAVARVAQDADNLRAAMQWARASDPAAALALACMFAQFCEATGNYREGRRWLGDPRTAVGTVSPELRARALLRAALLAWRLGETDLALAEASLELYRELGDGLGCAWSINTLGLLASSQGDHVREAARYAESLALARTLGDSWGARSLTAILLINQGVLAEEHDGDFAQAQALYEEGYTIARTIGQIRWMAYALVNLGDLAYRYGAFTKAIACYAQSARLNVEWGDKPVAAAGLRQLALSVYARGRDAEAARRAVRCLGAAAAVGAFRIDTLVTDRDGEKETSLTTLRARFSDAEFGRLYAEGRAATVEQAIADVLDAREDGTVGTQIDGAVWRTHDLSSARPAQRLTAREVAVLSVVAEGATDHEVAERLGLRPRTVTTYLTHIYAKLGVRTRTAAIRVAHEQHEI